MLAKVGMIASKIVDAKLLDQLALADAKAGWRGPRDENHLAADWGSGLWV